MIRSRVPLADDRRILKLIHKELLPYTQQTFPNRTITHKELVKRLRVGRTVVLTSRKGEVAGFIHYMLQGSRIFVDMLAVDSAVQGSGFGTMLLHAAERYGRLHNCELVYLFVDAVNTKAQRFYMRRGYRLTHYDGSIRCYGMEQRL